MRQHNPLGLAGAPGRMHEHGGSLGQCAGDQLVSQVRIAGEQLRALCLERVPRDQAWIGVNGQSTRIVVGNVFDRRALLTQIEDLVNLLLVFGKRETRACFVNEVADFIEGCIRKRRHRVSVESAGGQHSGVKSRAVVAEHQHDVTCLETQSFKTGCAAKHDIKQLLPRRLLPDALAFLAHGDPVGKGPGILRQNADQRGVSFEIPGRGLLSGRHARPRCKPRPLVGRRRRRPVHRCRSWRRNSTPACDRKCR